MKLMKLEMIIQGFLGNIKNQSSRNLQEKKPSELVQPNNLKKEEDQSIL